MDSHKVTLLKSAFEIKNRIESYVSSSNSKEELRKIEEAAKRILLLVKTEAIQ